MSRDRAQLAIVDGPAPIQGNRAEAWSDVERTIVKAALSSGVRRVTDLALHAAELGDARARMVWAGVLRLIDRGARVAWLDGALVSEIAKEQPIEHARASVEWVRGAADEIDSDAVDALVARVRDRIYSARVYALAARLRETVEPGTTEAASRAAQIVSELRDLTETRHTPASSVVLTPALDAWDEYLERAREQRSTGKAPVLGIATIDRWTRKDPGTSTIIGAESHVGKTGVMAGAVLATARAGIPAALISCEDTWPEIVARMAAEIGRLNPMEVASDQPGLDLPERLARARLGLVGLPVHGVKIADRTLDGVLAAIRFAAARGCKLVAVDYWNAIRRPSWVSKMATRRDASDEILASVLAVGAERGVHLVIGAQLNRDKARGAVGLNDLRESSAIGESAQNVIGLSRLESKGETAKRQVRATIAKAKGTSGEGRSVVLTRDEYGVLVEGESSDGTEGGEWGGL